MPLGKRTDCGDARYAGVEIKYAHDIAKHMQVLMPPVFLLHASQSYASTALYQIPMFVHMFARRTVTENAYELLDLCIFLQEYLLCGFDFVVAPLVQPGHEQPALQLPESGVVEPRLRKELMLTSAAWGGQVGTLVIAAAAAAVLLLASEHIQPASLEEIPYKL